MEVRLEINDRPWQHINGENGRASYHSLPPIAALTTCRPTAATRKEDHVFSVPNPPKPAGAPPVQRAPTPFPELQQVQRVPTPGSSEQAIRTSPVTCFPVSSPQPTPGTSDKSHSLSIQPSSELVTTTFQTVEQRAPSSPLAIEKRPFPLEPGDRPLLPADGARSTTPRISIPSPGTSAQSGGYVNEIARNLAVQSYEVGRNIVSATPQILMQSKDAHAIMPSSNAGLSIRPSSNTGPSIMPGSNAGPSPGCPPAESPHAYPPRISPAPSPGSRSQGDRGLNNRNSPAQVCGNYSPIVPGNYPSNPSPIGTAAPRSFTPTSNPSVTISRSFGGPHSSSEMANRYSSHAINTPLEGLRHIAHAPSAQYDAPNTAAQQKPTNPSAVGSSFSQLSGHILNSSQDQTRSNYGDRGRYPSQPPASEISLNYARQIDKANSYFPGMEAHITKTTAIPFSPSSFGPPISTRPSEVNPAPSEYSGFSSTQSSRQTLQSYSRHPSAHQASSSLASASVAGAARSQTHHPSPQAVPYFRTDTSSMVWTTSTTSMSMSTRPQDSNSRQYAMGKVSQYQTTIPPETTIKPCPTQQPSQGLPPFHRQGLPQHVAQQASHISNTREQPSARVYTQSYPQHSHQSSASTALPRINPPSVVNVTSTFTPRFSSPVNQSSAPYHGAPRVPASINAEEPRSGVNYSYTQSKQSSTPTTNGYSMGLNATLPRVNFPSPTAVSFDTSQSLPGSSAYGTSRTSNAVSSPSNNLLQYTSSRHPVMTPATSVKHHPVQVPPQHRHAYSQVQSHAAYSQQQPSALHSSPVHPRMPTVSPAASLPQNSAKYTTAQRQYPSNYTHQNRTPDIPQNASRQHLNTNSGFRPGPAQYIPSSSRNPTMETDTCRNPFELPPPSSYSRNQQATSVIKSHHVSQRQEDTRPVVASLNYPHPQHRSDLSASYAAAETSRHAAVPRALPISNIEERVKPTTVSARFPPVPQMNYDLQRQIYDRMTGGQKTPPRQPEKLRIESERRNVSKGPEDSSSSSLVTTSGPSAPPRQKRESPLDLSVKTVRQSADSTRDDADLYHPKQYGSEPRMTTAPKIDFTPNFAGPLVHPEARSVMSLPPVQTIRNFSHPQSDPSLPIPRKRPMVEHEPTPPKIPKVDSWKLAMDEQIEERLKAARPPRPQPAAPLTPAHPPMQSTTPTNPEVHSRMLGYLPSPGYSAVIPPRRESPIDSSSLHRPLPQEQMYQHMKKGREYLDPASLKMREWGSGFHQKHPKGKDAQSQPNPVISNDTQRLVDQISQGVLPDARLLQDRSVVNLLRNSLEEKEARLIQLQDAARKKQKLPSFNTMSLERMCVPPSYKHSVPRATDTVKIGVEPTRNYLRPSGPERPQDSTDLDGLAAFLAARIRTKAEMKQMGPSADAFRPPDQGPRPGMPASSPPKLAREGRVLSSPQRRRSEEPLVAPPRDPAGLRSSSETSVFDFRESDSEGEMPVLERQTLEGMRRDRKTHPRPSLPLPPDPEPGPAPKELPELEPDPAWDNACDMFVEQLQKRPVKRSVRKKKPNPKFFANEAEAPDFMKVKTEDEEIKKEPDLPVEAAVVTKEVQAKEVQKPKNTQVIKKEPEEPEKLLPPPLPVVKEEEISSSNSEEIQAKTGKENKGKTGNKRQRSAPSESEWESTEGSSSSSSESSESSSTSSESESEAESEPKGHRVQTRQQSRSIRPPPRMKLRSKRRGGAGKDDAFGPGWEEDLYKFKQQLRMPERLINISKPKKRGPSSLPDLDSETEKKTSKTSKKKKKDEKTKKEEKTAKKEEKASTKKKGKKGEKVELPSKGKANDRPSSAPPLTRRNLLGIITRGKEKLLRNGASAAVRRSNKAVQNSKRHLNKGKKRLKLRRKFRSGFDYMRRKKKQGGKKETETTPVAPPEPKRRERPDGMDVSAEVKSWVVNKGAGETVLHRAARLGYADVAAYCLDTLNVSPSPRDHAGYTPLHEACSRGHLSVAKLLLQYGASVSESARGGVRPLHQAAENNYIELIRLLLSYGADPLLETYTGQTALSLASQDDVQELITQHLADVRGEDAPKWSFEGPACVFADPEWGVDPLADPPSPEPLPVEIEFEGSSSVLPPLYRLPDDETNDRWMLLQDLVAFTHSRSVEALLSRLPGVTCREISDDDFRERASSCNLLSAPKASGRRMQLVLYDETVRQIMDVELVTVSLLVDD